MYHPLNEEYPDLKWGTKGDSDQGYERVAGAYLEHRCEEWVIGGADQVRQLIADLQKLLEQNGFAL